MTTSNKDRKVLFLKCSFCVFDNNHLKFPIKVEFIYITE